MCDVRVESMSLNLVHLRSIAELRAAAPRWDALWHRSDVTVPTARAETIAQWLERFAPAAPFHGLAVEQNGNFVAALPLVARDPRFCRVGGLPANAWGLCGDLLLDPEADAHAALHVLLEGVQELAWPLLWMKPVCYEADRWQMLLAVAQQRAMRTRISYVDRVGQAAMQATWSEYESLRSGNHRRHVRKARKRAERAGDLTLDVHREFAAGELKRLLRLGCEVEDLSWKGEAGTAILRSAGIFDWYLRQASQLAEWGQLQLTFLRHRGQAIAFEYGYLAKGTYYSAKVGYDPAFAHFSPGQLLRAMLFERFHVHGDAALVDFWGPLTEATAKWCTHTYPVGCIALAPDRLISRLALAGLAAARPAWGRIRGQRSEAYIYFSS